MTAPARLCAICVKRAAVMVESIDGRMYHVCAECITVEVDEPRHVSLHERVFLFLRRSPGMLTEEVMLALGLHGESDRSHVAQCLSRMVRAGLARYEGTRAERYYSLVSGAALAPKRVPNRVDMIGRRFGRLVVTAADKTVGREAFWRCRCDCGGEKVARGCDLRRGSTKSCGCLVGEHLRKPAAPAEEATCPAS
jgi:hypothetical protein